MLVQQGDLTHELYFISKGICKASCIDLKGQNHEIGEIEQNGIFGEIAHILNCKRTATVVCVDYVSLLVLPKQDKRILKTLTPYLKKQYLSYGG